MNGPLDHGADSAYDTDAAQEPAFKPLTSEEAAALIPSGVNVGMSGFTGAGHAKAVPLATVTGVDVNERAVRLMNENAAALGVAERAPHGGRRTGQQKRCVVQ